MKLWDSLSLPHIHIHAHLAHRSAPFSARQQNLLGVYPDLHLSADVSQQPESASAGFVPCQQTSLPEEMCALSIAFLLNQRCEMLKQWCHQKSTCELKPRCVCAVR